MKDQHSGQVPIACTLSESGQADRLQRWRALVARAIARGSVEGGMLLSFPADPALIGELAELAVREQQCCEFFSFSITVATRAEVTFEVRAPHEAMDAVAWLFGAPSGSFDPVRLVLPTVRSGGEPRS